MPQTRDVQKGEIKKKNSASAAGKRKTIGRVEEIVEKKRSGRRALKIEGTNRN